MFLGGVFIALHLQGGLDLAVYGDGQTVQELGYLLFLLKAGKRQLQL